MADPTAGTQPDLRGWTVVALRSSEQNGTLRRALRSTGACFVGVPALRLIGAADADTRLRLQSALGCPQCVFTSPAAVRFAARLQPLSGYGGLALAVGPGTVTALHRAGVREALCPAAEMNSEGLLALQTLAVPPPSVGLVTAPGGRNLIAAALAKRGAEVRRADVYRRGAGPIDRRHDAAVRSARSPLACLVTSAEALQHALAGLSAAARARLLQATAVVASARLQAIAAAAGFGCVVEADSATLPALLTALGRHANGGTIR